MQISPQSRLLCLLWTLAMLSPSSLLGGSSVVEAREVTIYPDGEYDPRSSFFRVKKPKTVLDVRKTTFFNVERTV